ncbi:predicted protein [Naegleria gruberi]|uniref:Predicted protein n=1 Tax=Naegleria gruberi TaxID=5762 RepID=D2VGG5_NAEGR|nr:uncharacterized protein NAEGRDRAFT_49339 [Naegleria gruberi]EFC43960.1 predicted protein [Naegleria gruberi]|eukprot:XP_002676704.1 predicted protein [Naegleria gruberi strain NEG-M]
MSLLNQDEECCTVELIDFSSCCNSDSYQDPMIGMLKQKLRSPKRIAFSNKFEEFKSIEFDDDVYDVRISRSCSLIVVVKSNCFVFIDYETLEIKQQVETACIYFELEEDYDNCGNDALLMNHNRIISKYDLKQFIITEGSCQPIWTYRTETDITITSKPINAMILDGKKVVIFNEDNCMTFLDAKTGTKLMEYTIKLESSVSGCFEPDRRKPNTLYLFMKEMMKFEYENGNWKCTSFATGHSNIDGLGMDRVSGILYFSGYCESKWSISAYTTCGTFIGTHSVTCSGFYIDERTGLMYMAETGKISIVK